MKRRNKQRGKNKSQKAVGYEGKLGPAPKRIPNSITKSISLKPNKNKSNVVELQLRNEAKRLKQIQAQNKLVLKAVVEKAIKEEKDEIEKYKIKSEWSKDKPTDTKEESRIKIIMRRNQERERRIAK